MATFNIKRGDTMPPLILALRVSGSDPVSYWDIGKDDLDGIATDNAGSPPGAYTVRFIMTDMATGEIIGRKANVDAGYTGPAHVYEETIGYVDGDQQKPIKKTLLRYNWQQPDTNYNPKIGPKVDSFGGDTVKAGVYKGEFEILYNNSSAGGVQKRKRTFPSTPGDILVINVLPDSNDKTPGEST